MKRQLVVGLILLAAAAVFTVIAFTDVLVASAASSGPPADAKYVGTNKCRSCHMTVYRTWRTSKHGKNFSVLKGDETKNPECLKCHTTGFGKPGGYSVDNPDTGLQNTGCEACHGPGSAHAEAAKDAPDEGPWEKKINKTPQNACIACHNPHINQADRVKKLRGE